jgi:hypothetical protein
VSFSFHLSVTGLLVILQMSFAVFVFISGDYMPVCWRAGKKSAKNFHHPLPLHTPANRLSLTAEPPNGWRGWLCVGINAAIERQTIGATKNPTLSEWGGEVDLQF